jgi:hypothetical protein
MQALLFLNGFVGLLCGERIWDGLAFAFGPTLHMAKVKPQPA